ncbi:MAG: 3-oxoacyl-(acyl-carrier-protein) reductase [Verrucomicrobiales bacterium]|nr:3-oxoacyl-(acyl-carrier-protein) reductase [Verrucomicrobiales bacterium]MDB6131465.1 3-oxoacyl-(acyl-carrier-protein) reductase [Verrucomicrobiales bacterium]
MKKVVIITGANSGIGQAIAHAFLAEHGENVVALIVHKNRERCDILSQMFSTRTSVHQADLTQEASCRRVVEEVLAMHGRIDGLINNAGTHKDALLATMPLESWRSVIENNLTSTFSMCQAVLPSMISQRFGRIINIASLSAMLAPAGQTNYAAAKAGIVALTQSLAKEIARIGITVNAISPGFIETEALMEMSTEQKKEAAARVPMRRLGRPEEVAAAVVFLASQSAGYITGSNLKIDGGIL